jgi:chromosome segregation ATPase
MKRRIAVCALILGALGTGAMWRSGVSAQVRQTAQDQDVLPALLTEVRSLRVAMEQMASAGPRVQLALGRLQLQEQRVNTVVRQLDSVRSGLAATQSTYERVQQDLTQLDEGMREPQLTPNMADELKAAQKQRKLELARLAADVQRLTAEESNLSAALAAEQGRWTDLNQSMEELERTLTRK